MDLRGFLATPWVPVTASCAVLFSGGIWWAGYRMGALDAERAHLATPTLAACPAPTVVEVPAQCPERPFMPSGPRLPMSGGARY